MNADKRSPAIRQGFVTTANMNNTTCIVKPCTLAGLAATYGVSKAVMRRWLQPFQDKIGERRGWYYTALQVALIFRELGVPGILEEDELKSPPVGPGVPAG